MTCLEDRGWMYAPRWPRTWVPPWFEMGVDQFTEFCLKYSDKMRGPDKVKCPCILCHNTKFQTLDMCKVHLYHKGFVKGYHCWIHQGESPEPMSSDICDPPIDNVGIWSLLPSHRVLYPRKENQIDHSRMDHNQSTNFFSTSSIPVPKGKGHGLVVRKCPSWSFISYAKCEVGL